jgi:exopolysaccharide biosynthesis polyprenyl glycosylphosphotransferase
VLSRSADSSSSDEARASALAGGDVHLPEPWRIAPSRLVVDAIVITAALAIVAVIRGVHPSPWHVVFGVTAVTTMKLRGAYDRRLEDTITVVVVRHVLASAVIAAMITVTGRALVENEVTSARNFVLLFFLATLMLGATRVVGALLDHRRHARGRGVSRAIIIGSDSVASRTALRLRQKQQIGLIPIGYVNDHQQEQVAVASDGPQGLPVLGRTDDLARIARHHGIDSVIVTEDHGAMSEARLSGAVAAAHELRLTVFVVPRLHEAVNARTRRHRLGTLAIDELRPVDPRSRAFRLKYAIDRVVGVVAVALLMPLLLSLALLVKLTSPGPVLYRQRRVGLDGQEFDILKFRSMRIDEEPAPAWEPGQGMAPGGVEGSDRRTPLGRFLRRSNLDELPQLLNIARGEMCLVGPRPERPEYVRRFGEELAHYDARHRVKAGLTGWAQVHGYRGQTSIDERAAWDNYYIENWSFALDFAILVRTVKTFFDRNE